MAGNLTRRDLLKMGAIITAAAGCSNEESLGQPAPAPEPVAEPAARNLMADVVVVGAGYAGLGAAWELFKNGQSVIVLEANSRVGGRVWSSQLSDGTLFEIGGQWVSDAQPDIRTLMSELGVGNSIYPTPDVGLNVFVAADGTVSRYNPHSENPLDALPPIDGAAKLEAAAAFLTFQVLASVVNVNAPWEDHAFPEIPGLLGPQTTVEADQWTVDSWIELNILTDDAKALLRTSLSGATGMTTGASPTIRFPAIPPQNPASDNYFEFNWSIEEFAHGDFAAVLGPGVYTGVGFGPSIRAPFGRIHWAGVDTATTQYMSFSAAVQSGRGGGAGGRLTALHRQARGREPGC